MIGRIPLWVAKQHGHSISTMLSVYAGWTEGSTEADIGAIKRAMALYPLVSEQAQGPEPALRPSAMTLRLAAAPPSRHVQGVPPSPFATEFATRHRPRRDKCLNRGRINGGREGFEPIPMALIY
jgi:hypothetical protein